MGSLLLSEPTLASRFERKKKKKRKGGEERRRVKWKRKGKGEKREEKKRAHSCSFSFENWQRNIYTLEEDTRAAFS